MSRTYSDNTNYNTNSYAMLDNYCGLPSKLGVSSVAPVLVPYGYKQGVQNTPIFMGENYNKPPYESGLLFSKSGCGAHNGYSNVLDGYHVPKNKDGNPISNTKSVYYLQTTPVDNYINQTCAETHDGVSKCNVQSMLMKNNKVNGSNKM